MIAKTSNAGPPLSPKPPPVKLPVKALGWALWRAGDASAERGMHEGLEMLNDLDIRLFRPLQYAALADLRGARGAGSRQPSRWGEPGYDFFFFRTSFLIGGSDRIYSAIASRSACESCLVFSTTSPMVEPTASKSGLKPVVSNSTISAFV
jgi:hypothetical protein